ncbi:cytochrome P450 superfamily protein [Actinidia rufa]|uniref:Cytochrome P450 superfamily protein n=1 Tax=Actinidia rufa TaxID=165716 RepID=A0A7J0D9K2_9ERIC|nr:cytochrome P450 superfamily protein [Actinidia rufa]
MSESAPRLETSEREVDEMARLFSDFVDGCLSVPINFPGFAYHTAMKARESIISKINKTIEKHRQEVARPGAGVGNGLVGRLLDEESLADDVIADFVINLLFAGNETTAKTMLFAVYFLTHCPTALNQLLVIDETLRLGGIAIWLMREAKEDIEYQGLAPKFGVKVSMGSIQCLSSLWSVHRPKRITIEAQVSVHSCGNNVPFQRDSNKSTRAVINNVKLSGYILKPCGS